jgi:hypothetical protein
LRQHGGQCHSASNHDHIDGARLIRGRSPLDPLDVPVYIAFDWETRQR